MQAQTERDRLVETHLDYARKLTLKIFKELGQPKTVDVDDLLAYGANGLVEAAGRFDPTRGVAFTTFSYYRIRGAVFDGLRKIGWLSRGMARLAARAGTNAYLGNLADREGGEAAGRQTTAQAAEDLANTLDNVATIFLTSMDGVNDAEMPDENATAPDEDLHKHQVQSAIREAMKRLPERERTLLELHYYRGLSLKAAGDQLGASRSWASRLHTRAVQALTQSLGPSLVAEFNPKT